MVRPRSAGSATARTTSAAASAVDVNVTGARPEPKTNTLPFSLRGWLMEATNCSRLAPIRIMVQAIPEDLSASSAANFMRRNSSGASAAAPCMDIITRCSTPPRFAASRIRNAPSRSTLRGVPPLLNPNPDAANTTCRQPSTASMQSDLEDRSPRTTSTPLGFVSGNGCELPRAMMRRGCPAPAKSLTTRTPRRPVPPTIRITVSAPQEGMSRRCD